MISPRKIIVSSAVSAGVVSPLIAFAAGTEQSCSSMQNLTGLFNCFGNIVMDLIGIMFIVAWLIFLWGMVTFIRNADDSGKREEGRQYMLWSVLALFAMVAVWSVVGILSNTFGFSNSRSGSSSMGSFAPASTAPAWQGCPSGQSPSIEGVCE